ncbi:hypothetical protein INR49_019538, partial [Caranx melampygus]
MARQSIQSHAGNGTPTPHGRNAIQQDEEHRTRQDTQRSTAQQGHRLETPSLSPSNVRFSPSDQSLKEICKVVIKALTKKFGSRCKLEFAILSKEESVSKAIIQYLQVYIKHYSEWSTKKKNKLGWEDRIFNFWLKPQGPPFSSCALCEAALHSPAQPSDGATAAFQTQTIHGLQPCCSRSVFRAVFRAGVVVADSPGGGSPLTCLNFAVARVPVQLKEFVGEFTSKQNMVTWLPQYVYNASQL